MKEELRKIKSDLAWLEDLFYEYIDEMKDTIISLNRNLKSLEKIVEGESKE